VEDNMSHRPGAAAYEITIQDFSQAWVLGRHLEQKVTGLRAQIMEVNGAGFRVRRLARLQTSAEMHPRPEHPDAQDRAVDPSIEAARPVLR
jgi:hypothetical protein